MTRIVITGAGGRMGRTLIEACHVTKGVQLTGATEYSGSILLGSDAGELAGLRKLNVTVVDDLQKAISDCDAVIDFTRQKRRSGILACAVSRKK